MPLLPWSCGGECCLVLVVPDNAMQRLQHVSGSAWLLGAAVLDDNRMLCLPNGERIKLDESRLRMMFEAEDLLHASPATVSR